MINCRPAAVFFLYKDPKNTKKRTGADISASMDKKELKNLKTQIKHQVELEAKELEENPIKLHNQVF